jgi:uncharacterized cupin superfamily protein
MGSLDGKVASRAGPKGYVGVAVCSFAADRFDPGHDTHAMRPQRQNEDALVLEGEVIVTPDGGGAPVEIKAGDYCTFPKGMSCTWDVSGMVRPL